MANRKIASLRWRSGLTVAWIPEFGLWPHPQAPNEEIKSLHFLPVEILHAAQPHKSVPRSSAIPVWCPRAACFAIAIVRPRRL
jgi:hypothetical protein